MGNKMKILSGLVLWFAVAMADHHEIPALPATQEQQAAPAPPRPAPPPPPAVVQPPPPMARPPPPAPMAPPPPQTPMVRPPPAPMVPPPAPMAPVPAQMVRPPPAPMVPPPAPMAPVPAQMVRPAPPVQMAPPQAPMVRPPVFMQPPQPQVVAMPAPVQSQQRPMMVPQPVPQAPIAHQGPMVHQGPMAHPAAPMVHQAVPYQTVTTCTPPPYAVPYATPAAYRGRRMAAPKATCTTKDNQPGTCVSPAYCLASVEDGAQPCNAGTHMGVCCPNVMTTDEASKVEIPVPVQETSKVSYITKEDYEKKKEVEQRLKDEGIYLEGDTADSQLQDFFHPSDDKALGINKAMQEQMFSSETTTPRGRALNKELVCQRIGACPPSKYRSFDGTCNNLQHGEFGMAIRSFSRLLPQAYSDGKNAPRTRSVDGSELPSAREIVTRVVTEQDNPHPAVTKILMQWGQIIGHDVSLSAITKGSNGSSITCCSPAILKDPSLKHPGCFPIHIPANDPFYSKFKLTCMEFVRSLAGPQLDCQPGPREQINQVTSFLDASLVYGSNTEAANELRTFTGGLMQTSRWGNVDLLPFDHNSTCTKEKKNLFCYKAGDFRINMVPDLTSVQVVLLREHNRVARIMQRMHPNWNDEQLYQETRRIVSAEIQHVTYNEYLPILLGPELMKQFNLMLLRDGYSSRYNASMDATLLNEFATAAFRVGHNEISATSDAYKDEKVASYQLREEYFRPYKLQIPGHLDMYLKGLCRQPVQRFDQFITKEITEHLFQVGRAFGLDLLSFDIQRGRDHGLKSYNDYRAVCGMQKANNWEDIVNYMRPEVVDSMQSVYRSVDDIDLIVGGMFERPLKRANMGPTFACIVAEQFRRIKLGDRFWYENGGLPNSFTPAQLQEIRKAKLSKLICDNADSVQTMQTEAFIKPASWNPQVPCNTIPSMNLQAWA